MKVSVEWLKDYADIDVSTKELADRLTMTGSKVEAIEYKGADIKNVVIGKILSIDKHPDADKLVVASVDVKTETLQIVTGATNINVGDIIPIVKDGGELPGGVKIKKGKLRGVESCGMMCALEELGLTIEEYPNAIEDGIFILDKEFESELGKDVTEVLGLREDIIEFELTSNRPDCMSVEGLGRETAATLNVPFKNQHVGTEATCKKELPIKVSIDAPDLCYRYVGRVVKNVKIAPSPNWLVRRLNAAGVRAINNIVDITNYVMIELGQPMHAFDINYVEGKTITVRNATKGEKITTLDEIERTLTEEMLVIADSKKPIAVAGVMGGENSGILDTTETVVFESAMFNPNSVRKTARTLGLRTEASSRYEKGLSAENALKVINRAIELVNELGAGEPEEGIIDVYPTKQKQVKVEFDENKINARLGTNISKEEMINILEKLEFKVEEGYVIAPCFRQDVELIEDISEEIMRMYGYDKLESTLVCAETTLGKKNKFQKIEDKLKNLLSNRGLHEIYTYGFINEKALEKVNKSNDGVIKIMNPLSEDYTIMRTTTIASFMENLSSNYNKKNKEVGLFEIARVYSDIEKNIEKGELPKEERILTIGMYGEKVDFYALKGYVEDIINTLNIKRYEIVTNKENASFHPGRAADIVGLGTFGEVNPKVCNNYDISVPVYIAEINFDELVKLSNEEIKYKEIPKYPAVERDLAIIVDENIEVGDIEKTITKRAKKVLEELKLFDIYRSESVGENKKSVAYSLIFRSAERTLTDDEIRDTIDNIIKDLEKEYKAELRK